jgi:hypothetical protein
MARKRLSEILGASAVGGDFRGRWHATDAAQEFDPLPPGTYLLRVIGGDLFNAPRKGTPGYRLTLEVAEGEYEGRRLWHDVWLSEAALPLAKRDLAKLGITDPAQLETPPPSGILIRARVALRHDDDGGEHNRLVRFEAAGVEPPDPFAPDGDGGQDAAEPGMSEGAALGTSTNGTPGAEAKGEPPAANNGASTPRKRARKSAGATRPRRRPSR